MNNPFLPGEVGACRKAFETLVARLESLHTSRDEKTLKFLRELDAGKMLGVLLAEDQTGQCQTLYAFSGQLGEEGFGFDGFVPPVFDYLQPGGYFKTKEAAISAQNREIERYEKEVLAKVAWEYEQIKVRQETLIAAYREEIRLSKLARQSRREALDLSEEELQAMIRQSQFEKAELHRLKKRSKELQTPYLSRLEEAKAHLGQMKEMRREESENLQRWLFDNFLVRNGRGETKSLTEIFAGTPLNIPPSGAGECCAPKLLQAAYLRGWRPIAIAEYWYGAPKGGEVRRHGEAYPACRGKCLPILSWMLQGLEVVPSLDSEDISLDSPPPEILYECEWFCVVNKPSGMLSVPGKSHRQSLQEWLVEKFGPERDVRVAHRLDQDTSGLLIATFGPRAYKTMQSIFATRQVKKTYIADLDGDYRARGLQPRGRISLPLMPDWLDRPRQRVDFEAGKEAVTEYSFLGVTDGKSRVEFHPLSGRTHQLRIHAASELGLAMPIIGDRLYGRISHLPTVNRLRLHAQRIEFIFPLDSKHYSFQCPVPF